MCKYFYINIKKSDLLVAFFYLFILHCALSTVHCALCILNYFSSARYLMVRTIWLV